MQKLLSVWPETALYLSPEMKVRLFGERIEVDLFDVFTLGVTLLHLAKLREPTSLASAWRQQEGFDCLVDAEMQGLPCSPALLQLLRSMLSRNLHDRPLIEEVRYITLSTTAPIELPGDLDQLFTLIRLKLKESSFVEVELLSLNLLSTWGLVGLEKTCSVWCVTFSLCTICGSGTTPRPRKSFET